MRVSTSNRTVSLTHKHAYTRSHSHPHACARTFSPANLARSAADAYKAVVAKLQSLEGMGSASSNAWGENEQENQYEEMKINSTGVSKLAGNVIATSVLHVREMCTRCARDVREMCVHLSWPPLFLFCRKGTDR